MTADYRGRFVWHELMTTDPNGAQRFYTSITPWGTQPFDESPTPYTMWTNGGAPLGGVTPLPPELQQQHVPPHWLTYVGTPDIAASLEQAKKLGARVVAGPGDVPNVGRWAVLMDPQGAAFAMFQAAADAPGHDGAPNVGEFSWHELITTDYAKAFDFYSSLFGWEKMSEFDMGPMGIYFIYGRNGQQMGGMYNKPAEMPFPPNWLPYASVADVHKSAEGITKGGGTIMNGPMEVPGGDWIVMGTDPQGAAFALHQRKS